ncbi:hypothetical protein IIB50_00515 [Patescibacteria group bacterium]|nr:hypothetical protein [Patescibacteria group bacterium]
MQRPPIQWNAFEYEHKERTVDWFWALGIVALAGTIAAFMLSNILFGVLIVIGSFTLALFANRHPDLIQFKINERGVVIGDTLYPYKTLDSFWISDEYKNIDPKLIIKSKKVFMPYLIIPLADADCQAIHDYINKYLEEKEHNEPLSHKILELFGF